MPLAATLAVAIVSLVVASTRALSEHRIMNQLAERNRTALYRMIDGVRPALKDTVLNVQEDRFEFTLPSTFDGTNTVPGDTIRYEFRTQGNQGQLVRTNVGTGQETILCANADVVGSRFTFNGTAVVMTVVNTAALPSGLNHTVSNTVTVGLRN